MLQSNAKAGRRTKRTKQILRSFAAGAPLFPRSLLEDLNRQLALGKNHVYINDFDNNRHEYSLKAPAWCRDAGSYRIRYNSLQSLTNLNPSVEEHKPNPVSITYATYEEPRRSLASIKRAFRSYRRAWMKSETYPWLMRQVRSMAHIACLNKIVCFGLGSLGLMDEQSLAHPHTQHAAVETIVKTLKELRSCDILCYAQDPAYNDADKEVLRSIGITPINDPKGFLEVDSNTLVISVNPNIPVKQIIADVQWPGGMIWNTVEPEGQEMTTWTKIIMSNRETWLAPFTTDPDSPRVRHMVQQYSQEAFQDVDKRFGDLTIYIRKPPQVTSPT